MNVLDFVKFLFGRTTLLNLHMFRHFMKLSLLRRFLLILTSSPPYFHFVWFAYRKSRWKDKHLMNSKRYILAPSRRTSTSPFHSYTQSSIWFKSCYISLSILNRLFQVLFHYIYAPPFRWSYLKCTCIDVFALMINLLMTVTDDRDVIIKFICLIGISVSFVGEFTFKRLYLFFNLTCGEDCFGNM